MRNWLVLGLAAWVLAIGSAANANSIGLNFSGGSGDDGGGTHVLAPPEVAGVVPQANWNDGPLKSGGPIPLVDSSGDVTPVTATWSAGGTWGTTPPGGNPGADSNDRLLANYLDAGQGNGSANVTFNNVPAGTYDVYVYTRRNETGSATDLSDYHVNGTTQNVQVATGNVFHSTSGWVEATPTTVGNYVLFSAVSPVGGTITLDSSTNPSDFRSPVDAVQLVSTPEPASIGMGIFGLSSLALLGRRNRKA